MFENISILDCSCDIYTYNLVRKLNKQNTTYIIITLYEILKIQTTQNVKELLTIRAIKNNLSRE